MTKKTLDDVMIEILIDIEKHSSRNEKGYILESHWQNEYLKQVLEYAFNPYKVYGIGDKAFGKKFSKGNGTMTINYFKTIIELLDYLLVNNTGTDNDKIIINTFINSKPTEHREYYERIILKDLKIGITEKSINKIFPNLIPTFTCMLAEPFEKLYPKGYWQYKIDGARAIAIKRNGLTKLFSRKGKEIEGFDEIVNQLNLLSIDNIVIDGELSGKNFKDTMEKVFKKKKNKKANFMVFDILTIEEFEKGISEQPYEIRREVLEHIFKTYIEDNDMFMNLTFLDSWLIENATEKDIVKLCQDAIDLGFEGIMFKNADGLYYCKRTFDWQKVKKFLDGDFEITKIEEGKGKNKGKMGKIVIDVNGVENGLGSGWSDLERIDMWKNPNNYIGKMVEVQYQEIIEKSGKLRFPTVIGIRYDK